MNFMVRKLGFWVLICSLFSGVPPVFGQELVKARIGVEVVQKGDSRLAKSRDVLTPENQFRLLIIPDEEAYVYLVHSDFKNATLVFSNVNQKKLVPDEVTQIPPKGVFYQLDGTAETEALFILCTRETITEVDQIFGNETVPHSKWQGLYKDLKNRSKIKLSNKSEKTVQIGGNLRGFGKESLISKLRKYTGNSILTKDYRFNVKK